MNEIRNSHLLSIIMDRAEALCTENKCSGLTRDYIVVAALTVLNEQKANFSISSEQEEEYNKTLELLKNLSGEKASLENILAKWRGKDVPFTEKMILAAQKGKALNAAKAENMDELPADLYLAEILREETSAIKELHKGSDKSNADDSAADRPIEKTSDPAEKPEMEQPASENKPASMGDIITKAKKLQITLQESVLGQQHAVSTFAAGFFQSELQANIDQERRRPRATFLFAGPPGVGKTFLSEEAARILKLPFRRFDMSEYTGPNATDELCGSDANYKASAEGLLTGFVKANPQCVVLFDEIEKASLDVIHLFLQILDAGRIRDNRTDEEVPFKDAILIFTTNAGRSLYEDNDSGNLSALSRDVILDALSKDVNPKTKEPFFPEAICSRFASGNVVMFNHLGAHSLRAIVEKQLSKHIADIKNAMGITVNLDESVATAILLSEGASADARRVKGRADAFFGGELYELFRLLPSQDAEGSPDKINTINIVVNIDDEPENIKALFSPRERLHAVAYSNKIYAIQSEDIRVPIIHYARTMEEAKEIIGKENIQLVLCDLFQESNTQGTRYLNREDYDSPARDFLQGMLTHFPEIPLVLTEYEGLHFTEEEKYSYLRKGVRGFLSMKKENLCDRISEYTDSIFQQNSLTELARANRLVHFETAQSIAPDGKTADIVLFDMKMKKAVKGEDAGNILSMLSTPDKSFDDIIGADDAKKELKFFVSYMKDPKKYRRQGAAAPKGVLLYGPPGTGKTMLAKAFAAESNATFIATEGNQFYKGIVGQGAAMVHRLFATARRYAPAVIFIDEIDTIAKARSGRDTDLAQDSEQILTALFAEMDGFATDANKPVFVLGATNYQVDPNAKMSLDPAMLRRFDRRILIDLPSLENRKKFLKKEIEKREIFRVSEQGINSLAERSTGMSLALMTAVLDMAIRTAMQNQAEHIDDKALEEAFETYNSGEARKWNPETTLRTARHEAGHTLISYLAGEKPAYVTIVSRGNYGGYMQYADQEERMGYTRQELLARIRTALGGRAAEIVYYGKEDGISTGASGDLQSATRLAKQMICVYGMDEDFGMAVVDPENSFMSQQVYRDINEILKEQLAEAVRLITENKNKMDQLVEQLILCNNLRKTDIDNILKDAVK